MNIYLKYTHKATTSKMQCHYGALQQCQCTSINIHDLKTKENQNENFLNLKGFPHSYMSVGHSMWSSRQ